MRKEHWMLFITAGFFCALIIFVIILYKPVIPYIISPSTNNNSATKSDTDIINSLNSKIKSLEKNVTSQSAALQEIKTYIATSSAQPTPPTGEFTTTKSIISVANTKGFVFTTNSANYTPMGMYVNVKCPKSCYLWINFYSSSQNTSTPDSAQGYTSTFSIFLNNSDQSIYSQASYPTVSSQIPISLNSVIPVNAGIYTVDIRAKTSGGTLQSNVSSLQVMVIEK